MAATFPLIFALALASPFVHGFPQLEDDDADGTRRPIFDQIFEPVLGEVGTLKFVEHQVSPTPTSSHDLDL